MKIILWIYRIAISALLLGLCLFGVDYIAKTAVFMAFEVTLPFGVGIGLALMAYVFIVWGASFFRSHRDKKGSTLKASHQNADVTLAFEHICKKYAGYITGHSNERFYQIDFHFANHNHGFYCILDDYEVTTGMKDSPNYQRIQWCEIQKDCSEICEQIDKILKDEHVNLIVTAKNGKELFNGMVANEEASDVATVKFNSPPEEKSLFKKAFDKIYLMDGEIKREMAPQKAEVFSFTGNADRVLQEQS